MGGIFFRPGYLQPTSTAATSMLRGEACSRSMWLGTATMQSKILAFVVCRVSGDAPRSKNGKIPQKEKAKRSYPPNKVIVVCSIRSCFAYFP